MLVCDMGSRLKCEIFIYSAFDLLFPLCISNKYDLEINLLICTYFSLTELYLLFKILFINFTFKIVLASVFFNGISLS